MYQIKQVPEDFIVKEISDWKIKKSGQYSYFWLEKKNWTVLDALAAISHQLSLKIKDIGFAGNKDKKAVTEQLISIKGLKEPAQINKLKLKDIKLTYLGQGNVPLTLGDLIGNYFEITVRNLDSFKFKAPEKIVNYFDRQRFGSQNIALGKSLIQKDFPQACQRLNLKVENNDYVGALKKLTNRLLLMYVHAYQSYLWNETVKETVGKKIRAEEVPLVGFGTDLNELKPEIREIIQNVLLKEGIVLADFIIRPIPVLSLEGGWRKVYVPVQDFKVLEKGDDEINLGKKKVKISFILEKGSYATRFIEEMVGSG